MRVDRRLFLQTDDVRHGDRFVGGELVLDLREDVPAGDSGRGQEEQDQKPRSPAAPLLRRLVVIAGPVGRRRPPRSRRGRAASRCRDGSAREHLRGTAVPHERRSGQECRCRLRRLRGERKPRLDPVQVLRELLGGLVAVLRVLRERAQDDRVQLLRDLRADLGRRLGRVVQVLHRDLDRRVAGEGHLPGQHLVEDDRGRVEVGGRRHGGAARLLGGEVLRGAHDRARLRHLRRAGARDAEVRHLQPLADEDVVRLDVAVDDPVPVCEAERLEDLVGVRERLRDRKRAARHDELLEAPALDHLHRDVVGALGLAAVVDRDDVRVRQGRGRLGLAAEALDEEIVVRVALVQDLDRDAAAEVLVLGEVDVRHPARAELAHDAVAAVEKGVDERVGARHLLS